MLESMCAPLSLKLQYADRVLVATV